MVRSFFCLSLLILANLLQGQSEGAFTTSYRIETRFTDLQNTDAILGHHFGKKQYKLDTARINDKGIVVFENQGDTTRLGVYLIYIPGKRYFDILLNEPEIVLETSVADPVKDMRVIKSEENKFFFEYLNYLEEKRSIAADINQRMEDAEETTKANLKADRQKLDSEVQYYLAGFVNQHKGKLVSKVVNINRGIQVPDAPKGVNNAQNWKFYQYKDRFWEYTDLNDERLLFSPWFEPKLEQYITKLTLQHPDSIISSADKVIEAVKPNKEMFRYAVNWITNHYETSNLMTSETPFVHMVENYYKADLAWWVDSNTLYRIQDRAKKIKPLLIGKKITNLVLKDDAEEYQNLHKSKATYTVLYFYDPECGHCKEEAPLVEEVRQKYAIDGVEVWGINIVDETIENKKWNEFIDTHNLQNWTNVANYEGRTPLKYTYDIKTTPSIIVIDKDKNIVLKRIAAEQLGKILPDLISKSTQE